MMSERPQNAADKSLGELFGDLSREVTTLVRQELNLAKAEMSQKAGRVGKDVGMIVAGGLVAYLGAMALVAAIICILAQVVGLPWWASTLIVGALVTAVGGFVAMNGLKSLKREDLVPHQTIDSLKEDVNGVNAVRNRASRLG